MARRRKPVATSRPETTLVNPTHTKIAFVLDESGSMQSCKGAAINGFNEFLQTQQNAPSRHFTDITLTLFSTEPTTEYENRSVTVAPMLNHSTYFPNGNTALYDAVADTIKSMEKFENENTRFLVVILTDGQENASRRWRLDQLKQLIETKQSAGNWSFAFMGSNQDAWLTAQTWSIPRGNTMTYDATPVGTMHAMGMASAGTYSYTTSNALKTTTLFETDLSNLNATVVKTKLQDVQRRVRNWLVDRETPIKDFCERQTGSPYIQGCAFYQLTKPEIIQGFKQIMIREKGKKPIYTGAEARSLLNLPTHDVKVNPGNHANWDVFVQSTSPNRKLVRGTRVIYTA